MKLLKLIQNIKNDYIKTFGPDNIRYHKGTCRSCVEQWINELGYTEYIEIFSNLVTNQWKDYVLIKYDSYCNLFKDQSYQDFWDMYDGLYRECRSVVIDVRTMQYVLRPFDKFFNMDERGETSYGVIAQKFLRSDYITIMNKLDGSMQCARYYNGEYIMSGSQAIDPEQSWRLMDGYSMLTENYRNMLKEYPDYTFIFEYISKRDAHVVIYNESQYGLHLLAARNVITGDYLSYNELKIITDDRNIPLVECYEMGFDDLTDSLKKFSSDEKEGYVVRFTTSTDEFFVKIKCDDYVEMHGIVSAIQSPNIIIKHIIDETFDDFISKIPETRKETIMEIARVIYNYNSKVKSHVRKYAEICMDNNADLKSQMIWVTNNVPTEISGWVRNYIKGERRNIFIKPGTKFDDFLSSKPYV